MRFEGIDRHEAIKFLILRTIGNFLVLFSIFGVIATFGPALFFEANFRIGQLQGVRYVVAEKPGTVIDDSGKGGLGELTKTKNTQILVPKDTFFDIVIPKIGANAKVYPNISPNNEEEYLNVLQKGVAHAKGTVFPGMQGTTYLFAHSTDNWWNVGRYNAIFYLLKDVAVDDDIVVFFKDKRYNYKVGETKIVDGDDVSYLADAQSGPEQLVLQTCWPPGTTIKRLVVIAKPVK